MASEESHGKSVLITGCSTGIGRATAERLAKAGWTVYATARNPESVADLAAAGCKTLPLDVNNADSIESAVQSVEAAEGAVGVLINNAGFSQSGPIETVPLDAVRRQFETNVFGPIQLIQRVLPAMRERRSGRIVNISSMGGRLVFPGGGYYHATKYALEAISDALRFEVAGFGIKTIVVQPGLIRTAFAQNVVKAMNDTQTNPDVYRPFDAAVRKATEEAYDTPPLSWLSASPEKVAAVIEKAVSARNPKPRYKVALSAHMLMTHRRLSTDRMWDLFLRTQFPQPKA